MTRPEGFALKLAVSTCTSQQLGKEVARAVGRKGRSLQAVPLFHAAAARQETATSRHRARAGYNWRCTRRVVPVQLWPSPNCTGPLFPSWKRKN